MPWEGHRREGSRAVLQDLLGPLGMGMREWGEAPDRLLQSWE